ncbi:MAG: hypothetical protein JNM69_27065 [Archangium sp.]|nr:hypothetical protein [Archangium sp.]
MTLERTLEEVAAKLRWTKRGLVLPDGKTAQRADAAQALEDWLYANVFIDWRRSEGRFADSLGGSPEFIASLLAAAHGATWFMPHFRVLSREARGLFVFNTEIRLFLRDASQLRPSTAVAGDSVSVKLPCAREAAMPGYFCFNSRAGRFSDDRPHLKVYLNVTPRHAPTMLHALLHDRSLAKIRFDGKIANDPDAFGRRDTMLLYVDPRGIVPVLRVVLRHRKGLRPHTPPFVLQVAPGLGVAESPLGSHESFGAQRCRLVAEGLLAWVHRPSLSVVSAVASRFSAEGLDLTQPWLGSLSSTWVSRVTKALPRRAR